MNRQPAGLRPGPSDGLVSQSRRGRASGSAVALLVLSLLASVLVAGPAGATITTTLQGVVDSTGSSAPKTKSNVVVTQSEGPLHAELTWSTPEADLALTVRDPAGVQVATKASALQPIVIDVDTATVGKWTLGVRARAGATSYQLVVTHSPGTPAPPGPATYLATIGGPSHAMIYPSGLEVGPDGTVYVADTGNDQVAAYDAAGNQLWRSGFRGVNYKAYGRFNNPRDLAYLNGQVYVADLANNRVQVLDAATGTAVLVWTARFMSIIGITAGVDADGTPVLLVSDNATNVIKYYTPDGTYLRSVGAGLGKGPGQLNAPRDAATGPDGTLYVADYNNNRMAEFAPDGTWVRNWGTLGKGDGQLGHPYGVAVGGDGLVYVADAGNSRIQVFTGDGLYVRQMGSAGKLPGQFFGLRRVAVGPGPTPEVYGADLWGYRIEKFDNTGTLVSVLGDDGPAPGGFNEPYGVAVGPDQLYVMDTDNQRVQIFTQAGGFTGGFGDRGFGESSSGFNWARDITVLTDTSGPIGTINPRPDTSTLWVADTKNSRLLEFGLDGTATGAKFGVRGTGPGQFIWPYAISAYRSSLIVADTNNSRVMRVDPYTGQVVWTATGLNYPKDLEIAGNQVYVADTLNQRLVVLNADTGAVTSTIKPSPAVLHRVEGVAVAPNGTIWVADTSFNRIVELSPDGSTVLQTFGGTGTNHGQFDNPTHVEIATRNGQTLLYVVDTWNDRIEVFDITNR